MSEVTRKQKYETILEWWLDGWLDLDYNISILTDELMGLHSGEQKSLFQYNDEELNETYEEVIKQQEDLRLGELYE